MSVAVPIGGRRTNFLTYLAIAALVVGGTAIVLAYQAYGSWEIRFSGVLIEAVSNAGVYVVPERQTVYFGLGTSNALGLRMTPECSSVFLLVPLITVATILLAVSRRKITRSVLVALAVAGVTLILVNQARVLLLVGLIGWLGTDRGYYLGHTLFGSMVSVIGGAIALVLFVWLIAKSRKADPAT